MELLSIRNIRHSIHSGQHDFQQIKYSKGVPHQVGYEQRMATSAQFTGITFYTHIHAEKENITGYKKIHGDALIHDKGFYKAKKPIDDG